MPGLTAVVCRHSDHSWQNLLIHAVCSAFKMVLETLVTAVQALGDDDMVDLQGPIKQEQTSADFMYT